jgi:enoyl-CoA hydratase/carnithine racemase
MAVPFVGQLLDRSGSVTAAHLSEGADVGAVLCSGATGSAAAGEARKDVSMGEFVRLEIDGGVGIIRLDRPKMNALNAQVQAEITEAALEADRREDVAAVVVHGGERVFAAGADITEMAELTFQEMTVRAHALQAFTRAVAAIGKPTISAITGFALGGGCELALATDVRFAAENAKLGQPEVLLGIIPGAGGTQRLARLVGPATAKDLIFTGRFVSAQEALSIGLVDQVHPADEVLDRALAWAAQFVGGAALALRAAKDAIDRGLEVDLQTGLEIERVAFASLFATDDRTTGMTSFMENGPGKARFDGR